MINYKLLYDDNAHYILESKRTLQKFDLTEKLDGLLGELVHIKISNEKEVLFNRKGLLLKIWDNGILKYALVCDKCKLFAFDDLMWELVDSDVDFRVKALDKEDLI